MSILTYDDIDSAYREVWSTVAHSKRLTAFARAVEAAVIKKLATVSVEPVAHRAWFDKDNGARWLFTLWPEEERLDVDWEALVTLDQLTTAIAAARVQALEEAAKIAKAAETSWDAWFNIRASIKTELGE